MRENASPVAVAVAVVTGAGADIGASVARRLAAEGYAIAVVDRKESHCYRTLEAIQAAGGHAELFAGDVGLVHEAEAVVTRVAESLGEPSVLVNNLTVPRQRPSVPALPEDWDAVQRAGLRAPILLSEAVRRHMMRLRWGRIVNIGFPASCGQSADPGMATATCALEGLTRSLAKELGPYGVTVNAVVPGLIAARADRFAPDRRSPGSEAVAGEAKPRRTPGGRAGTAEDIAESVAFFVSRAAGFVSGQVLHVAGGPVY